jgi:hypothetical protein
MNNVLRGALSIEGRPAAGKNEERFVSFTSVTPGYFELTGIPIRRGRAPAMASASHEVAIDEKTARLLWPNEEPIGRRFRTSADGPWETVVGIVGDVHRPGDSFLGSSEHFYYPVDVSEGRARIVARVDGPTTPALSRLAAAALSFDPFLRLRDQKAEVDDLSRLLARPRFLASLFGAFAAVALVLAAAGLYGVLAYSVGVRRREIGVRMALGADAPRIARLIVGDAMRVVGVGLVLGIAGALAAGRLVSALLFDVTPHDTLSLVAATVSLALIALLAAWLPARRASRVDPMEAVAAE